MCLEFKLFAVYKKQGSIIVFLFVGRQDMVNYWDFPSNFFQKKPVKVNSEKFLTKLTRFNYKKVSPWATDLLLRFFGKSMFSQRFSLPVENCFLCVCLSHLFTGDINVSTTNNY